MKVCWSVKATARLHEIHRHIAKDSPLRATQVVDQIIKRAAQLTLFPRIDHKVSEYHRDDVCEILLRPYRIIYLVSEERIDILTVKHYRQRLPSDVTDF